jgi:hypothetical protein
MPDNETTANRGYQLPHATNNLDQDVARLRAAFNAIDGDVSGLLTAVAGKAATGHTHAISDVSGLQSALNAKLDAGSSFALDTLSDVDTAAAVSNMFLRFVNGVWIPVAFDASMVASGTLNPARMPAHGHSIAEVTALQAALDGKQAAGAYAMALHGHAISDVTTLQSSLNGKANISGGNELNGHQTITGKVQARGTGLDAAFQPFNTNGNRDWRVMQKDDGRFVITDETAGSERMAFGANGSVDITGTHITLPFTMYGNRQIYNGSGETKLYVQNGAQVDTYASYVNGGYGGAEFLTGLAASGGGSYIWDRAAGRDLVFGTSNAERMRIKWYGNILIGTSNESVWNGASGSGILLGPDGAGYFHRDNNPSMIAGRRGSDGDIALLQRDGVNIGSFAVWTNGAVYDLRLVSHQGNLVLRAGGYSSLTASSFNGALNSQPTYDLTGSGSNVIVTSAGNIRRTSSSIRYKTDVEDLDTALADHAIDRLRPVWYRSRNADGDDKATWSHFGLIAEEVDLVEKRLVRYRTVSVTTNEDGERVETPLANPEPEDVDYSRLSVLLLDAVRRMKADLASLRTEFNAYRAAHP